MGDLHGVAHDPGHQIAVTSQTSESPRRSGEGGFIRILLCCNDNYLQHMGVFLASLLENNRRPEFEILVVSTAEFGPDAQKLWRLAGRYGNCRLMHRTFRAPTDAKLSIRAHYTADIWTRLWVGDFFSPEVDRVLYLDCDMVVLGDLRELWAADLRGRMLGAVPIPGSTRGATLGIPENYGYFNSGVMLIDLRQWREEKALERVLTFARETELTLIDPDQDALNSCFFDQWTALPHNWNVISPYFFRSYPLGLSDTALAEIAANAKIIHFNGHSKPWTYMSNHPRKDEYYKYLSLTEWRDFAPADRTLANIFLKNAAPLVPASLKRLLRGFAGG
jgi:lipopolysaccharide biosynthesis glycosyltransferase